MNSRLSNFKDSVLRHGLSGTIVRYTDSLLSRYVNYELCRVEINSDDYAGREGLQGFVNRSVSEQEFHSSLCDELKGADYHWAFARGDICIASLLNEVIVGYTLYTRHSTPVQPGLEFRFPEPFVYIYGSHTASSQRGNRLESARWKAGQAEIIKRMGKNLPRTFYVNVSNPEIRAANRWAASDNTLVGYSGYIRVLGRWICFRSLGCNRAHTGFWIDAAYQPPSGTRV